MRIIKLSSDVFEDEHDLNWYFVNPESWFRTTKPGVGSFRLTPGRLGPESVEIGETLLFSYRGTVRYIATAASTVYEVDGEGAGEYPLCLDVDLDSLCPVAFGVKDLETKLAEEYGIRCNLSQTQAWVRVPGDAAATRAVEELSLGIEPAKAVGRGAGGDSWR